MSTAARLSLLPVFGFLLCSQTACNTVPQPLYRQAQLRALELHHHKQALVVERDQAIHHAQSEAARSQQLARELATAEQRLANLNSERTALKDQVFELINQARSARSPLDGDSTRRLEALMEKYPGFEFDPHTGVSKFHSDILFASGSAEIKPEGLRALRDFAAIMNQGNAGQLNILVVGHTDDQPIVKGPTKTRHPTNWHLSTNRADSVVLALAKSGLNEKRMGAAGYSMHQPVVPNKDANSRQKNRRVEIYVLAPDAKIAGWDPETSLE